MMKKVLQVLHSKRKISIEHFKEARDEVHPTITPEIIKWYESFAQKLKRRRIEGEEKEDRLFVWLKAQIYNY